MIKDEIYERVKRFMIEEDVSCVESVAQCDNVIIGAYEFIEDLFKLIEPDLPKEGDE